MTREQLEHAIRAVCDLTNDSEVYVFGSQAILGTYPDAPGALLVSEEVDLLLKNFPRKTDVTDGQCRPRCHHVDLAPSTRVVSPINSRDQGDSVAQRGDAPFSHVWTS